MKQICQTTEIRTPIYPHMDKGFKNAIERIKTWEGRPRNKELLFGFYTYLVSKGDKIRRISKLLTNMMYILNILDKDADRWTYQDIQYMVAVINTHPTHAPATNSDERRALKCFGIWREDIDDRPYGNNPIEHKEAVMLYKQIHKITASYKRKTLDYSEIITDEDCEILIRDGCETPMEEALVSSTHEIGWRASEALTTRLKDYSQEECGMIRVDGKTGSRRIPVIRCTPYLKKWLQYHPDKNNPEALMWISQNNKYKNKPLGYIGFRTMLERVFEKAGYLRRAEPTEEQKRKKMKGTIVWKKKKCNMHHFRHSRATLNASLYNDSTLCNLMGWMQGSKEAKTYVHLCGEQVKKAFLEVNNLIPRAVKTPESVTCMCGEVNNRKDKHCFKCYRALSIEVANQDAELKKNAVNEAMLLMSQVIANPKLKEEFEAFQKANALQKKATT